MANDDGFLSRWSRRKVQARSGEALPPEAPAPEKPRASTPALATPQSISAVSQPPDGHGLPVPSKDASSQQPDTVSPAAVQAPLPTMQDVMALTKESDYSAFVQPGVDPTVRNAAFKKLFSDPFFNEMDGLDIYIDDYSQPNPLPMSLARKLTSAKVLNLFETPEEKAARLATEAAKEAKEDEARHSQADAKLGNTSSTQSEPSPTSIHNTGPEDRVSGELAPVPSQNQTAPFGQAAPEAKLESDASRPLTP